MKKILLVYLPFCTPASPPYSLTSLYSFLKANSKCSIEVLDLNLEFHKLKFPGYWQYWKDRKWDNYDVVAKEYRKETAKIYAENNKKVVQDKEPEFFEEFVDRIKKVDVVAFSVVYSSQVFYAYGLIKRLKGTVKFVVGGPAVNKKLKLVADKVLNNEVEFLEYVSGKSDQMEVDNILDYSVYDLEDYFTPAPVIPLKTTSTCYYQRCTFCTHFGRVPYKEYSLEAIKETVIKSGQKYFFLVDDMICVGRLLVLAEMFKPLGIKWACQLRPTADFNKEVLMKLNDSGLSFVIWGVESGNNRILNLIRKGTNKKGIAGVLRYSHEVGIKNVIYMILEFPTETGEEMLETIDFLENNKESIALVSTAVFGLQKDTYIFHHAEEFGISNIKMVARTVLEPKITYEIENELSAKEISLLRGRYYSMVEKINKYPKGMNFFREHMFFKR